MPTVCGSTAQRCCTPETWERWLCLLPTFQFSPAFVHLLTFICFLAPPPSPPLPPQAIDLYGSTEQTFIKLCGTVCLVYVWNGRLFCLIPQHFSHMHIKPCIFFSEFLHFFALFPLWASFLLFLDLTHTLLRSIILCCIPSAYLTSLSLFSLPPPIGRSIHFSLCQLCQLVPTPIPIWAVCEIVCRCVKQLVQIKVRAQNAVIESTRTFCGQDDEKKHFLALSFYEHLGALCDHWNWWWRRLCLMSMCVCVCVCECAKVLAAAVWQFTKKQQRLSAWKAVFSNFPINSDKEKMQRWRKSVWGTGKASSIVASCVGSRLWHLSILIRLKRDSASVSHCRWLTLKRRRE